VQRAQKAQLEALARKEIKETRAILEPKAIQELPEPQALLAL
jgi:hypothetical protein